MSVTYTVEKAKSGRAKCRNKPCSELIEKDETRIGKHSPSALHEGTQTEWFHVNCFFEAQKRMRKQENKLHSLDELDGYTNMDTEDKELISSFMKGETKVAPTKKKRAKKVKEEEEEEEEEYKPAKKSKKENVKGPVTRSRRRSEDTETATKSKKPAKRQKSKKEEEEEEEEEQPIEEQPIEEAQPKEVPKSQSEQAAELEAQMEEETGVKQSIGASEPEKPIYEKFEEMTQTETPHLTVQPMKHLTEETREALEEPEEEVQKVGDEQLLKQKEKEELAHSANMALDRVKEFSPIVVEIPQVKSQSEQAAQLESQMEEETGQKQTIGASDPNKPIYEKFEEMTQSHTPELSEQAIGKHKKETDKEEGTNASKPDENLAVPLQTTAKITSSVKSS